MAKTRRAAGLRALVCRLRELLATCDPGRRVLPAPTELRNALAEQLAPLVASIAPGKAGEVIARPKRDHTDSEKRLLRALRAADAQLCDLEQKPATPEGLRRLAAATDQLDGMACESEGPKSASPLGTLLDESIRLDVRLRGMLREAGQLIAADEQREILRRLDALRPSMPWSAQEKQRYLQWLQPRLNDIATPLGKAARSAEGELALDLADDFRSVQAAMIRLQAAAHVAPCSDAAEPGRDTDSTAGAAPAFDQATLDAVRAVVVKDPTAKADKVVRDARVQRRAGRAALRKLEKLGEYRGFARNRPARYS